VHFLARRGSLDATTASVALQSDGRIIARGVNASAQVILSRYNTDGSIDDTFGPANTGTETVAGGAGSFNIGGMTTSMLIEPDDSILLGGGFHSFQMAHYSADGALDTSFASGGYVSTGLPMYGKSSAMALDGNQILLAGTIGSSNQYSQNFALARYNSNGSLDNTFGPLAYGTTHYGYTVTDFGTLASPSGDFCYGLGVLSDSTIMLGGVSYNTSTGTSLALARYNADGTLDTDFGAGGKTPDRRRDRPQRDHDHARQSNLRRRRRQRQRHESGCGDRVVPEGQQGLHHGGRRELDRNRHIRDADQSRVDAESEHRPRQSKWTARPMARISPR